MTNKKAGETLKFDEMPSRIQEGKRPEITGSGLIRSSGSRSVIKSFRRANIHFKSDERILGDSDFVERVLKAANESIERKYQLKSPGYDINKLADRVAKIFSIKRYLGLSLNFILLSMSLFYYTFRLMLH